MKLSTWYINSLWKTEEFSTDKETNASYSQEVV